MFFLSLSAKLLVSSEFIFWLKRPLTARIIQKAVSRTLKQSDIVLYAGGDAGVCIFEDGEAFIQICEKGGDVEWGNALRRKLNGLAQIFLRLSHFSKGIRACCAEYNIKKNADFCPLSLQLNSSDILWDLWHRNFSFKIMVSLWSMSYYGFIIMIYEPRNIDALNAAVVPKLLQNSKSSLFSEKMHFGE